MKANQLKKLEAKNVLLDHFDHITYRERDILSKIRAPAIFGADTTKSQNVDKTEENSHAASQLQDNDIPKMMSNLYLKQDIQGFAIKFRTPLNMPVDYRERMIQKFVKSIRLDVISKDSYLPSNRYSKEFLRQVYKENYLKSQKYEKG